MTLLKPIKPTANVTTKRKENVYLFNYPLSVLIFVTCFLHIIIFYYTSVSKVAYNKRNSWSYGHNSMEWMCSQGVRFCGYCSTKLLLIDAKISRLYRTYIVRTNVDEKLTAFSKFNFDTFRSRISKHSCILNVFRL